ncbi:hypothetical protein FKM82_014813 [Ascaphus truei]
MTGICLMLYRKERCKTELTVTCLTLSVPRVLNATELHVVPHHAIAPDTTRLQMLETEVQGSPSERSAWSDPKNEHRPMT